MIVINAGGLRESEREKVMRPYAKNHGEKVDFARAGEAAVAFLKNNPSLLADTAKLLDEAQQ